MESFFQVIQLTLYMPFSLPQEMHTSWETEFCTVVYHICRYSVWNLLLITIVVLRITRWFKYDRDICELFTHKSVPVILEPPCMKRSLDFWKLCVPLCYPRHHICHTHFALLDFITHIIFREDSFHTA